MIRPYKGRSGWVGKGLRDMGGRQEVTAAKKWEISDGRRNKSSRVPRAESTLTKHAQRGGQHTKLHTQPDLIYRLLEEPCTCTGN